MKSKNISSLPKIEHLIDRTLIAAVVLAGHKQTGGGY